jgi:anti-sigma factor RsiW
MKTLRHPVSTEDLMAYADGSLQSNRIREVTAHIAHCVRCRERLALSSDVGHMLRSAAEMADDPVRRAALKQRARQLPAASTRRPRPHPLVAGVGLIALLVVGIALQSATEAGSPLGTFVDLLARDEHAASEHGGPPGQPLGGLQASTTDAGDLAFVPVQPSELPLDLRLIESSYPGADRAELLYQAEHGLTLLVFEQVARPSVTELRLNQAERHVVHRTEVVIERSLEGNITRLVWERERVVFAILILDTAGRRVTADDATAIAAAIISAQDDALAR